MTFPQSPLHVSPGLWNCASPVIDLDATSTVAAAARPEACGRPDEATQRRALDLLASPTHWPARTGQRDLLAYLGQSLPQWPAWPKGVSVSLVAPVIPPSGLNDDELPASDVIVLARMGDHQIVLAYDVFQQVDQVSLHLLRPNEEEAYGFDFFDGPPCGFFSALAAGLAQLGHLASLIGPFEQLPRDLGPVLRRAWVDWLRSRSEPLPQALLRLPWVVWPDKTPPAAAEIMPAVAWGQLPTVRPTASPPSASAPRSVRQGDGTVATTSDVHALIDDLRSGLWTSMLQEIVPHVVVRTQSTLLPAAFELCVTVGGTRRKHYASGASASANTGRAGRLMLSTHADGRVQIGWSSRMKLSGPDTFSGGDAFFSAISAAREQSAPGDGSQLRSQVADVMSANPDFVKLCLTIHRRHGDADNPDALVRQCWQENRLSLEGLQLLDPAFVGKPLDAGAAEVLLVAKLPPPARRQWLAERGYTLLNIITDQFKPSCAMTSVGWRALRPAPSPVRAVRDLWLREDLGDLLHVHLTWHGLAAAINSRTDHLSGLFDEVQKRLAARVAAGLCDRSLLELPRSARIDIELPSPAPLPAISALAGPQPVTEAIRQRAQRIADEVRADAWSESAFEVLKHLIVRVPLAMAAGLRGSAYQVVDGEVRRSYRSAGLTTPRLNIIHRRPGNAFVPGNGTRRLTPADGLQGFLLACSKSPSHALARTLRHDMARLMERNPMLTFMCDLVHQHFPGHPDPDLLLRLCIVGDQVTLAGLQLLNAGTVASPPPTPDLLRQLDATPPDRPISQQLFEHRVSILQAFPLITELGLTPMGQDLLALSPGDPPPPANKTRRYAIGAEELAWLGYVYQVDSLLTKSAGVSKDYWAQRKQTFADRLPAMMDALASCSLLRPATGSDAENP